MVYMISRLLEYFNTTYFTYFLSNSMNDEFIIY